MCGSGRHNSPARWQAREEESEKLVDELSVGGRGVSEGLDVLSRLAEGSQEAPDLREFESE